MNPGLFDLHLHSTASDGQMLPKDLMLYAHRRGVTALALTDHDNVDGVEEAADQARELGLFFIPGVELSVDSDYGEMHILGYGMRIAEPLSSYLAEQKRTREERNERILARLQELKFQLTMEDVLIHARASNKPGDPVMVGRPHFAMALIAKGYVRTVSDAFNLYLAKGKPAHIERKQARPQEAIATIRDSGGVAVLAHPYLLNVNRDTLNRVLEQLIACGLEGLEAFHSDHDRNQQKVYCEMASAHHLLVTGGSDFHGPLITPGVEIGRGKAHNLRLTEMELVAELYRRIQKRHQENESNEH